MKSSRIAAQQSAVLHFFVSAIESFGASTVNIKSLLPYIFGPQVGSGKQQAGGQDGRHAADLPAVPATGRGREGGRDAERVERAAEEEGDGRPG